MQWPTFKTKLRKALESNTILGLVCLGLLFVAVLQQIKINSQHERIALKPPGALSEEAILAGIMLRRNILIPLPSILLALCLPPPPIQWITPPR